MSEQLPDKALAHEMTKAESSDREKASRIKKSGLLGLVLHPVKSYEAYVARRDLMSNTEESSAEVNDTVEANRWGANNRHIRSLFEGGMLPNPDLYEEVEDEARGLAIDMKNQLALKGEVTVFDTSRPEEVPDGLALSFALVELLGLEGEENEKAFKQQITEAKAPNPMNDQSIIVRMPRNGEGYHVLQYNRDDNDVSLKIDREDS